MWEMAKSSIVLFVQGRLFKDIGSVMRQAIIGVIITVGVLVGLSFAGLPLWAACTIGGFIGGIVQPYLFKDLKYA